MSILNISVDNLKLSGQDADTTGCSSHTKISSSSLHT